MRSRRSLEIAEKLDNESSRTLAYADRATGQAEGLAPETRDVTCTR